MIVCLGGTAAKALLGKSFKITQERGRWHPGPYGAAIITTFHPAYLLRLEDEALARAERRGLRLRRAHGGDVSVRRSRRVDRHEREPRALAAEQAHLNLMEAIAETPTASPCYAAMCGAVTAS